MKRILLAIPMIVGMLSVFTARSQWVEQYVPFGFEGYFYDMEAVNSSVAWGAPFEVVGGTANYTRKYAKTTDGGATWDVDSITIVTPSFRLSNIWPIDGNTCYVSIHNESTGTHGGVYKTTNGGATWAQVGTNMFTSASSFPNFVYFWDAKFGMVMGDPAGSPLKYEIYTTSDSGNTWVRVPAANIPALANNAEFGITNLFTHAAGHVWFATTYGDVYHSGDMGMTWTKSASGFAANISAGFRQDINDLAFTDAMNGIILQIDQTDTIRLKQTTDGGASWSDISFTGPFYPGDIESVPGAATLMSAGSSNTFGFGTSMSVDNGLTWASIDTNYEHTALSFSDNVTGWSGRYVLASNNTGGAWLWSGPPLGVISQFAQTKETQIYPNPSNGSFGVLGTSKSGKTTFEVFDMQGKKVYDETFSPAAYYNHQLNLGSVAKGLYVLRISDGQSVSQHKLVIE